MRRVGLRYLPSPLEAPTIVIDDPIVLVTPIGASIGGVGYVSPRRSKRRLALAGSASSLVTLLTLTSGYVLGQWTDSVSFSNAAQNGELNLTLNNETLVQTLSNILPSDTATAYAQLTNTGDISYDSSGTTVQVAISSPNGGDTTAFANNVGVVVAECSGTYTHPGVCSGAWIDITGLAAADNRVLSYLSTAQPLNALVGPGATKGFRVTLTYKTTLPQTNVEAKTFYADWTFAATQRPGTTGK